MHNFRKVLRTSLLFLLVLLLLSIGFMELYIQTERDSFEDASDRRALAGTLDTLIVGASHGYRDFNPVVIDGILGTSTYNLSGAMMTMQGRWELLREEVARNPVKTICFELSFNAMTRNRVREGTEGDLYVFPRLDSFFRRVSFFFSAFSFEECPEVYRKFVSEGIEAGIEIVEGKPGSQKRPIRGYLPTGPRTTEIRTDFENFYHTNSLRTTPDPYNVEYFTRIMELCREKGIRVIFVTTPITKAQICKYDNFDGIYRYYQQLAAQYGCEFYDFNLYREKETLFPDLTAFYDNLHLNPEGADRFSELFANVLAAAGRGEDVSARFYASYYEMQNTWGLTKAAKK